MNVVARIVSAPPAPATAAESPTRLKIGVLTFHRCINYGSYWQARCLVEGLCGLGHDAELLDHEAREITSREWRCAMQPLLPRRSSREDVRLYARKARAFERAFATLPQSRPFPLRQPEVIDGYDMVVIGSDEVWNLAHPWYGGFPLFFGSGISTRRLVSYAASFGNYDAEAGLPPQWVEPLRRFDGISVRDDNSRRLIEAALGAAPALVLDPCLQFPPDSRAADAPAPGAERPDGAYAAVYGHSFPDWFASAARRWARRRGLRLVSVGYRNACADDHRLDAGPAEFLHQIAGSSAVLTNFFHGCVFALRYSKPFACAGSPYRLNKLRDLTRGLGAGRHLVDEGADAHALSALLDAPLPDTVCDAIFAARRRSDAYLRSVLC